MFVLKRHNNCKTCVFWMVKLTKTYFYSLSFFLTVFFENWHEEKWFNQFWCILEDSCTFWRMVERWISALVSNLFFVLVFIKRSLLFSLKKLLAVRRRSQTHCQFWIKISQTYTPEDIWVHTNLQYSGRNSEQSLLEQKFSQSDSVSPMTRFSKEQGMDFVRILSRFFLGFVLQQVGQFKVFDGYTKTTRSPYWSWEVIWRTLRTEGY